MGMIAKPINRVFGSKARVAQRLLSLVPPGKRIWAELFAGTASLTLSKEPHPSEYLNDLDGDIVGLFRVLRNREQREELIEAVALTPWSEREFGAARLAKKTEEQQGRGGVGGQVARAWAYLVRSWMGVSGDCFWQTGFKVDTSGGKNCALMWGSLPDRIAIAAQRLKRAHIHCRPAVDLARSLGKQDQAVLFVDPPYPARSVNTHTVPYRVQMSEAEHGRLAEALTGAKAAVILTMAAGTLYDDRLRGWRRLALPVRGLRNVTKEETIFLNFDPPRSADLFAEMAA